MSFDLEARARQLWADEWGKARGIVAYEDVAVRAAERLAREYADARILELAAEIDRWSLSDLINSAHQVRAMVTTHMRSTIRQPETREAPREPGWYWRRAYGGDPYPARWHETWTAKPQPGESRECEWWSRPIAQPGTELRAGLEEAARIVREAYVSNPYSALLEIARDLRARAEAEGEKK